LTEEQKKGITLTAYFEQLKLEETHPEWKKEVEECMVEQVF